MKEWRMRTRERKIEGIQEVLCAIIIFYKFEGEDFFLVVLKFELRASPLLDRGFTT
jgi:hypothetical protein